MADKEIIAYTGNECQESKQLIDLLEEYNVEYTEKNVSENRDYLKELQARSIYSAPVIFIGEQVILGFQGKKIRELIQSI